jgi:hypothetical protein
MNKLKSILASALSVLMLLSNGIALATSIDVGVRLTYGENPGKKLPDKLQFSTVLPILVNTNPDTWSGELTLTLVNLDTDEEEMAYTFKFSEGDFVRKGESDVWTFTTADGLKAELKKNQKGEWEFTIIGPVEFKAKPEGERAGLKTEVKIRPKGRAVEEFDGINVVKQAGKSQIWSTGK